ncbi:MAG: hypothetical protein AB7S48_11405 [Bacteroidales bacterium]
MIAFIKFLFYFFLAMIILGFISRILLKYWLQRVFKRINQAAGNNYQNANNSNENPSHKKKFIDKGEGDYVDYEEVK